MTSRPSLETLERQAENRPESVDVRALCEYLCSDEYEQKQVAEDVRDAVIENATDLSPVVESFRELLSDESGLPVRTVGETLYRVVRADPDELAPLVAVDLGVDDVRRRGVALDVLGRTGAGVVRPYLDKFAEYLDDSDERVAALALAGLSTAAEDFPGVVAEYVPQVRPYLVDEWIPDEDSGLTACYSRTENEGDVATGEPAGIRLTNRVVRPYSEAVSIVHSVALTHPSRVESVLPRIEALVSEPPEGAYLKTLIETLARVARADPDAVESVVPALERYAEADRSGVRIVARNLLLELGHSVERPDPITVPDSMATRDRPVRDGDEELTSGLDEKVIRGEAAVDAVLPLLRCEDTELRDHAAWGLSCGGGAAFLRDLHERAESLLALLNEPHDCTRTHLFTLLSQTVGQYPEEWTPALVELASHEDPLVRRSAVGLLKSATSTCPALVWESFHVVDERLDDENADVRANAISVLGEMATSRPETVAEYVPTLVAALDDETTRLSTLTAIRNLAKAAPNATANADVSESVASLVDTLAGPDAIADRAQWSRKSHVEDVGDADHALKATLSAAFWLAKGNSEPFDAVRPDVERIAKGRYYGHNEARKLLVVLDSSKRRD